MTRLLISIPVLASLLLAQPPTPPKPDLLWASGAPGAQGTEDVDKPTATAEAASSAPASTNVQAEAEAHAEASQPLAITAEAELLPVTPDTRTAAVEAEVPRDSKAS